MTAKELLKEGEAWTDTAARAAFPVLLRRAMDGETITYGGLNQVLVEQGRKSTMALTYRYAAGKVGDVCEALAEETGERIPLLNAIVVNSQSGLPSHGIDGYITRFLGKKAGSVSRMPQEDRDAYARKAMETALAYEGWDRVRKHLGIGKGELDDGKPDRGEPIPPPDPRRFAGGPESDAHKALKAWVASHPKAFAEYGRFRKAATEHHLSSGDRLDVLFDNGRVQLAVEVKAADASNSEVQRGVYQCVKYRATLRAMQLAASMPPNAQAILVLGGKPPRDVVNLAVRLSVVVRNVRDLR